MVLITVDMARGVIEQAHAGLTPLVPRSLSTDDQVLGTGARLGILGSRAIQTPWLEGHRRGRHGGLRLVRVDTARTPRSYHAGLAVRRNR